MAKQGKHRSGFEAKCGEALEPMGFEHEPFTIEYTIAHNYKPDFVLGEVLVEAKGWFRPGDRQKYKAIARDAGAYGHKLVFLLQSPNKKVQKGAQLTMSGWCEKEGIPWFSLDTVNDIFTLAQESE